MEIYCESEPARDGDFQISANLNLIIPNRVQ